MKCTLKELPSGTLFECYDSKYIKLSSKRMYQLDGCDYYMIQKDDYVVDYYTYGYIAQGLL